MPAKLLRSLLLTLLILPGCRKAKPPAPKPIPPSRTVKSEALKIEVAALPAGFTAVPGAGDPLRLTGPDGGAVTISRGTGTDPGSVELLCQFGRAFLTRGRSLGDRGDQTETIRIFLTSAPGRPLVLAYAYPAATSRRERLDQALAVLRSLRAVP
jgi:hypothetical protein